MIKRLHVHAMVNMRFPRGCYDPYRQFVFLFLFTCCQLSAQNFAQSTLPIIVLNTNGATIQDEPKIVVDMGIIFNGEGIVNHINDPHNNYKGKIEIEIRGSSSQMFPKKQYGIKLIDKAGVDKDTVLLGLPAEEDWILFAPYNDKSLMRDVLAYKLGRDMGRYAPRTRFCELILNGEYQGIYVLIEKIKRDKNRVDIKKLEPEDNSGDNVTGGYIIKIDKTTGLSNDGWTSDFKAGTSWNSPITFLFHYPEPDEITAEQKQYIQNYIKRFEQTLNGSDFKDQIDGYAKYIDMDSFVDFMIMNELTKNVDGYRLSTFLHKQNDNDGGKLVMGPIWDFNLGFGNADYCTLGNPEDLVLTFNSVCPNDWWQIPNWWYRFLQDPSFTSKLATRWVELRKDRFSTERIHQYIDSTATAINEAQIRNFQRWPVLDSYVWPNYYVGSSYENEVNWLKGWIASRMQWLDYTFGAYSTTASEQPLQAEQLLIAPFANPFSDKIDISYDIKNPGTVSFDFFSSSGKLIEQHTMDAGASGSYSFIIGSKLPEGLNLLVVRFNGKTHRIVKLIKKS